MLGGGAKRKMRWRARSRLAIALAIVCLLRGSLEAHSLPSPQTQPQAQAPDVASYHMEVRLDPAAKTVSGTERITYRNPSPDTLRELWLRLYLRAFSSTNTIWMQESGGEMRGYALDPANLGDITVSSLSLADGPDLLASTSVTDTLMRVPLPAPLGPGQAVELDAQWTSKLPRVFARTGYGGRDDTFFMVGQWYPKMAVYHQGRWDTEPWHANAEFFHDFGDYDVSITVPEAYVVAGAGVPAGETAGADGTKTLRFVAESITDFAFAASPDFQTRSARAGDVDVVLYYLPEHAAAVPEYMQTAVGSLQAFSSWYGAYPHPRLTVVDVPDDAGGAGGMEYPTLVTGGTLGSPIGSGMVAVVTSHEIAHQWWPMQTATNEGREPWLDEGITQYTGSRYMVEAGQRIGFGAASISALTLDRSQYAVAPDHPSTLPAWGYSGVAYGSAVYSKPALGLWTLESVVGTQRFRRAMADYLARYRWKHPTTADFRASLEQSLGEDLDWLFDDYLDGAGVIDYAAAALDPSADGNIVRVRREGDVRIPVEVEVVTAGGVRQAQIWDGQQRQANLAFDVSGPITEVMIDPRQQLKAELDLLDNGDGTQPELGPATTLGGRLAFWSQAIVQLLGLFG
jgi:hypothetical protein